MKTKTLLRLKNMGLLIVPLTGCGDDVAGTTFGPTTTAATLGGETGDSGDSGTSTDGMDTTVPEDLPDTDTDTTTTSTTTTSTTDTDTDTDTDTSSECIDGETQSCYTGLPGTENVGTCKGGVQSCANGMWGACIGETLPQLEQCNNLDENCNGVNNDGNPGGGTACFTGMPGICGMGSEVCNEFGMYVCESDNLPAPQEICFNNLDDNCNGQTDEFCFGCPYVYAFDGHTWQYETSIGGAGLVGRDVHQRKGIGKPVRFAPIWARLDAASILADRSVQVEMLAAEDEIVYVDNAQLTAVHHPAGHEVISSSALQWSTLKQKDPRQFWAFPTAQCRTPVRARWCDKLDQREALSQRTGTPAAHALDLENFYDLDFGQVRDSKRAWLLIDGWKFKRSRRGLAMNLRGEAPKLEIRQTDGSWLTVKTLAAPRGDRKTIAISLADLHWPTGSYEMRLFTGTHEGGTAMWYLDRVRLVEATPAPLSVSHVPAARAQLEYRGVPSMLEPQHDDRPRLSRNDGGGRTPGGQTYGKFTRYGDVMPLLRTPDDRVVVMRQGDNISLRFENVPEPPPGFETTLFLRTNLVYKTRVPAGAEGPSELTENVDPMPSRRMRRYRLDSRLRDDSAYLEYLAQWNTREYLPASLTANVAA